MGGQERVKKMIERGEETREERRGDERREETREERRGDEKKRRGGERTREEKDRQADTSGKNWIIEEMRVREDRRRAWQGRKEIESIFV
jgi:hypothetical protein